ncbi:hypothetical protein CVD25_17885 [Bacillus canaveralius]|uniref:Uncharacterized protein n=1 Tax=Bacillus canaveralius TaxID=1403243 RepID=A0A2N5GST0_9BACI|nr:hypothetical protein [Bacillus canaveralius]PLR86827.1 hypothetical protein CU635_00620 [Bacillus canaveralius]PLR92712.1 hypothetical protein CVD25_17885 [Bacillus canaveralius]RSK53674.1 hypothetical protein EJA13_07655 [Bacillus canaveralius]
MSGQSVTISTAKAATEFTVNRMACYHRVKVLEVISPGNEPIYLFFYKNRFILGKSTKISDHSRLKKVFTEGIIFSSPHPLIDTMLLQQHTFPLKLEKQVQNMLRKQYSSQETALILSFFDSFMPKHAIIDTMKAFFYEYRRNGQLRFAYQILMIIIDFEPENTWAQELSHHVYYQKYKLLYDRIDPELHAKDSLYSEMNAFYQKESEPHFAYLQTVLSKEARWHDLLVLYIDHFRTSSCPEEKYYDQFIQLITAHLSEKERSVLLSDPFLKKVVKGNRLQKEVFEMMIDIGQFEDAINLITEQPRSNITGPQQQQLAELFEKNSLSIKKLHLENLRTYLIHETSHVNLEKILQAIIPLLLSENSISYVHNWLQPLLEIENSIPTMKLITSMFIIQDDPDKQFSLGQYYHKFKQYEKAIECFTWEMELKPDDPNPVQWLTKVYRELGMVEESNNYLYIYSNMQKA